MRELSEFEENLVELVHFLAYGSAKERGLTLREVKQFLATTLKDRKGRNVLESLAKDGRSFINELKTFMNEMDDSK